MNRAIALAVALTTGACGKPEPVPPLAQRTLALDRPKLDHVSLLARGRLVDEAEWQRWRDAPPPFAEVVDAMLSDPFLYRDIAPGLLFRNNLSRMARMLVIDSYDLAVADVGGHKVYNLQGPCKLADTVEVAPWWDPAHPVKVCKQAVRADVWETTGTDGTPLSCDLKTVSPRRLPRSPCGCGPNLFRCWLPGYFNQLAAEAQLELRETVGHVAWTDEPLAGVFTMNQTWRRREVERWYLRQRVQTERIADPAPLFEAAAAWPDEGKLGPRHESEPGQHAGALTMPQIRYHVFDPRQTMRIVYEGIWCAGESAPGAKPEDLLRLHTSTLSTTNEGWQELAARPFCTDCHARLDYGMQFFAGYGSPDHGAYAYLTGGSSKTGPLYGVGIGDGRGEGPLTPSGFAAIATRQSEFARCMASDVAEYVFGPRTSPASIERLARSAAPSQLRFRGLMRLAVMEFLQCDSCEPPSRELLATREAATPSLPLRTLIDDHCTACHTDGAPIPNFELKKLPRSMQLRVMDHAVFGRMPPDAPLSPATRRQFAAAVLGSSGDGMLDNPAVLVLGHAEPPAALPLGVVRQYLRGRAEAGDPPAAELNALEIALAGRDRVLTPNYVAMTAIEASRSCEGVAPAARAACIQRALDAMFGPIDGAPATR